MSILQKFTKNAPLIARGIISPTTTFTDALLKKASESKAGQVVQKAGGALATELARPVVTAGAQLYSGIQGGDKSVDMGRWGTVYPVINPKDLSDTRGSKQATSSAFDLALTAATLGTGTLAKAGGKATLTSTLGSPARAASKYLVSPAQKVLGSLPSIGKKLVPQSATATSALKRLGIQGTADAVVGATSSAMADRAAGREITPSSVITSGAISALFPLGIAGTVGVTKGLSRQVGKNRGVVKSSKNILRTVAEDADLLDISAQSLQDRGNLGRVVRQSLEDKENQIASRIVAAKNAPAVGGVTEARYKPSFLQSQETKADELKLKSVQFIRDFTKNFVDDRAPISKNLSGKLQSKGATIDELTDLQNSIVASGSTDAQVMGRLNRVRENVDSIRPPDIAEADFMSMTNKYSSLKTKVETERTDIEGLAKLKEELDSFTNSLPPNVREAVEQAHEVNVRQFNRELLDEQIAAGLISRESADAMIEKYPNYSRLIIKDYLDKPVAGGVARKDVQGLKQFGRSTDVLADVDDIPAMEANAIGAILSKKTAANNTAALKSVDLDQRYGGGVFQKVDDVGADTITIKRDGVEEIYKVNDRQVLEYFQKQEKVTKNVILKALEAGADMTRKFATGVNPAFMITNTFRDFQTAQAMLPPGVVMTMDDWVEGLDASRSYTDLAVLGTRKQGSKLHPLAQEALDLGAPLTSLSRDAKDTTDIVEAMSNLSTKKSSLFTNLEKFNNISELTTRIAVLSAAKKAGIKDKAVLRDLVKNATVDFRTAGEMTREINRVIPFLNARIQGLRNTVKKIAADPAQAARRAQVFELSAQTVLDGANARYGDLENKISQQEREDNFVFITGKYKDDVGVERPIYVRIPKGSMGQIASIFKNAIDPEADDNRSTTQRSEDLLLGLLRLAPIDGIPDVGGAFLNTVRGLQTNKDWRGYDIVPEHLNEPDTAARLKKSKTTSEAVEYFTDGLSKLTGGTDTKEGLIELSPAQVDFAIRTLFSGTGSQGVAVADLLYNTARYGSPTPKNLPDDSRVGLASKLPILSSFAKSRGLSVDPEVESANVSAARNMSLLKDIESDDVRNLKDKVLDAATPEERYQILKSAPKETVEKFIELQSKKAFIEGVNPFDPVEVQAIQIYNGLQSKKTPEEKAEFLKTLNAKNPISEKKLEALAAYRFVQDTKGATNEEKYEKLKALQQAGLVTEYFLDQIIRYKTTAQ